MPVRIASDLEKDEPDNGSQPSSAETYSMGLLRHTDRLASVDRPDHRIHQVPGRRAVPSIPRL